MKILNNKLRHLTCVILCNNYYFLIFSEVWLNLDVLDSELGIYYYNIFRFNGSDLTNKCNRGGRVSIGIKNNCASEIIKILFNSVEQVFILIKINNKVRLIIGACYIPEVSLKSVYEIHVNTSNWIIECFGDNIDMIASGDYNFRGITFSHDSTYIWLA